MSAKTYVSLYWARVRAHPFQELLAGVGITIGVALAFAVTVANGSISASSGAIVRSVTGTADWQLSARDPNGFDASVIHRVRHIPGVKLAAPVLDQRGVVSRGTHTTPVNVASISPDLAKMSGRFGALATGLEFVQGAMLTTAAAQALGIPDPAKVPTVTALPRVTVAVRGRALRLPVAAILGDQLVGPLASAPAAVFPLARLQAITGMEGRVTRILIDASPGRETRVHAALAAVAARDHLALTRADVETRLLRQALGPSDWTTGFFAAIAAMLGFMLAFNAMLLTAPERRRTLALMRLLGTKKHQITVLVLSQAVALGVVSSLLGIGAGVLLAGGLFDASPRYLAPAFVPGSATIVHGGPLLLAALGGVASCVLASVPLLAEVRRRELPLTSITHLTDQGDVLGHRTWLKLLAIGAACGSIAAGLLVLTPAAALGSVALLALATVCVTPAVFRAAFLLANKVSRRSERARLLTAAVYALRATTIRSLALAATGAVAVFGCISIESARTDLLRGIASYTNDYVGTADLWVVNGNDNQATEPIDLPRAAQIARSVPGVAAARVYRGSFLDWSGRRVWIIGKPRTDAAMLPASQLRSGNLAAATRRLRTGGWAAISDQLARHLHVRIGDHLSVPTPAGTAHFRIAALTTNLGWTPGAVIINATDYRSAWGDDAPTAIEVDVQPGAKLPGVQSALSHRLGDGVRVQPAAQRAAGINASARQGLARLRQISMLLLLGAVLAMAAALSAAIWQRRLALAKMRILGLTAVEVWRTILIETAIVLGSGCLAGAAVALAGQVAIDRYLIGVTGFPIDTVLIGRGTIETFAIVLGAALAVVAVPGWWAARVSPTIALQAE